MKLSEWLIFLWIQEFNSFFSFQRRSNNFLPKLQPYDTRFNEIDKPIGPPYVLDRPGKLSFNLGKLRFRQTVYDQNRNLQQPFRIPFKPGKLSFRIGPFKFLQTPTQNVIFDYFPCCVDYAANCYQLVDCDRERKRLFGH